MRNFKWILNWKINDLYTDDGETIPVRKDGNKIGICKILISKHEIIGEFNLEEEINENQYVMYSISNHNPEKHRWLEGILILDAYSGIENRAKKVSDMIEFV
jgi:hypothetical protein